MKTHILETLTQCFQEDSMVRPRPVLRPVSQYTVTCPSLNRTLSIRFNQNFPYDILSWSESYSVGTGGETKVLTTKARRTHAVMIDYWNKNNAADIELREKLGLTK